MAILGDARVGVPPPLCVYVAAAAPEGEAPPLPPRLEEEPPHVGVARSACRPSRPAWTGVVRPLRFRVWGFGG